MVVFLLTMHSWPDVWQALSFQSMAETTFWYTGAHGSTGMNTGINWSTILFITGMMILVEGMSGAGFFDWLCLRLAKLVGYKPVPPAGVLHDSVGGAVHVHRQHHRHPLPGGGQRPAGPFAEV